MTIAFPCLQCDMMFVITSVGSEGFLGTEALQSCLPHQLDLRTGQLWADGQSTLQLHQQLQVVRASAYTQGSLVVTLPGRCSMIEPTSEITEGYGALVGLTLVDTSNWSARVSVINPGSEVMLPPFSCVGDVVQVFATSVARAVSVGPDANQPLPPHLEDIVAGSHHSLGEKGRATLRDILLKYVHVFPAPGDRNDIETNGARSVSCGPRHLALIGLRTEQECINNMLDGGQIEPSDSLWASPVALVTKKDGSMRF